MHKRVTAILMTGVASSSIKLLLQMEINCITLSKDVNVVSRVYLGISTLRENSNSNLLSVSKLRNSR
jgi:hypothetical protein